MQPEEVYYFNNDPRKEKAIVYLTVNQSSYNSAYREYAVLLVHRSDLF